MANDNQKKSSIERLFLCGDAELAEAIGISDTHTLKHLRDMGLPRTVIGKHFLYDPDKVRKFINDLGRKQIVK